MKKETDGDAKKIIDFIDYAEKLKVEFRQASKSDNSRESVADHCWRLALMLILIAPKLKIKIDLLKTLKMAIIHDLVEIESKDVPILKHINNKGVKTVKEREEKEAIAKIKKMLGDNGKEVYDLWYEFEALKTNEAKVLRVLDRLEGQLQFLSESVTTFTPKEQEIIDYMLEETTRISKIDPFIEKLDLISLKDRKNRIKH